MTSNGKSEHTLYWEKWASPFGPITVSCSAKGVRELSFGAPKKLRVGGNGTPGLTRAGSKRDPGATITRQALAELRQYAAGRRKRFTVPLDLEGTPFQLKVWKALVEIPYGETRSYQQIACQAGNPRAARAVGMANHWNPVAIIVPCHRVIASDGTLGGYGGGLDLKTRILQLEQSGR